jgi:peptidoglycan/LPS O-acetylase OafA/YrhL
VLVNLTMLHAWFGVPHVDGVYWSLFAELSFYVLACTLFFLGLFRFPNAVAWAWIVFCLGVRLFEWHGAGNGFLDNLHLAILDDQVPGMAPHRLSAIARLSCLAQYAPLFMAGILFYHLFTGQRNWKIHVTLAGCFLAHNLLNWSGKLGVVVALAIFIAFYLFAYGRLKFVALKPLLFLGMISYPLYLVHCNVGMAIMRQLQMHGININLAAFVAIAAALVLATVISYGFEQPGTRLLRNLLMRKAVPAPAGSTVERTTIPAREPVA